jgi:hypothetical protein
MVQVWRVFSALRLVPLLLLGTVTGVVMLDGWGWLIGVGCSRCSRCRCCGTSPPGTPVGDGG